MRLTRSRSKRRRFAWRLRRPRYTDDYSWVLWPSRSSTGSSRCRCYHRHRRWCYFSPSILSATSARRHRRCGVDPDMVRHHALGSGRRSFWGWYRRRRRLRRGRRGLAPDDGWDSPGPDGMIAGARTCQEASSRYYGGDLGGTRNRCRDASCGCGCRRRDARNGCGCLGSAN